MTVYTTSFDFFPSPIRRGYEEMQFTGKKPRPRELELSCSLGLYTQFRVALEPSFLLGFQNCDLGCFFYTFFPTAAVTN